MSVSGCINYSRNRMSTCAPTTIASIINVNVKRNPNLNPNPNTNPYPTQNLKPKHYNSIRFYYMIPNKKSED